MRNEIVFTSVLIAWFLKFPYWHSPVEYESKTSESVEKIFVGRIPFNRQNAVQVSVAPFHGPESVAVSRDGLHVSWSKCHHDDHQLYTGVEEGYILQFKDDGEFVKKCFVGGSQEPQSSFG